jgi:hypothetical protein
MHFEAWPICLFVLGLPLILGVRLCNGWRVCLLGLHGPDLSDYVMVFMYYCYDLCCGVVYLVGGDRVCR